LFIKLNLKINITALRTMPLDMTS